MLESPSSGGPARRTQPRAAVGAALALVLAVAALAPRTATAQGQAAPADGDTVKVVVALLPFRIHSSVPLDYLETSLVDLLASRLEASGRVEVVDTVIVRESVVDYAAGDMTEDTVRKLARDLEADYVVTGSLTELAGRYSLDVRVTPVEKGFASETMVFTADGDDELLDRVNELAEQVVSLVTRSPQATVVEVKVLGPEPLASEAASVLRTRVGDPYASAAVREDLESLRALRDVATANVETARGPKGVIVQFRIVPAANLMAESDTVDESDRVAEIRVSGNRRIESDAILARIGTQPGDPYRPAQVAADVREVYALGFFRNVRVTSQEGIDGRVLTFDVEENPVVRRVTISGNEHVDNDQILDTLTLTAGSTLDYPLLFENQARIESLYRAEGYYLASVQHEVEALDGNAVAIHFTVDEHKKLKLREIIFLGNEHLTDKELARGMRTKPWRWWSYATKYLDNSGTYSEPVFAQDLRLVEEKYMNHGYLQVEVDEAEVEATDKGIIVTVRVREGDQFTTGSIEVRGDNTVDIENLRSQLHLREGETFNRSFLTADVEGLTQHYTNRGFYFASVNPLTKLSPDQLLVDVVFEVEKGPLYFVREIEFEGNTTTIDPVLRREMQLVEGQLYSARALQVSQSRLRSLGFFEEVNFEPKPTDHPGQIDLDVNVVEKPTGSLSFGAGFSTQDSIVVSGSLSQTNLFGRGYGAQLSVDWGGRSKRIFGSFSDPYVFGSDFSLAATGFYTDVEFEDFDQQSTGLDLVLGHSLNLENTARAFLRLSLASQKITQPSNVNASSVIFRQILADSQSTNLLGLTVRSDSRNDRVAPTSGGQFAASLDYAGLGGFSQFLRGEARIQRYFQAPSWWPVFAERSTFMLAARAGYTQPFNDISDYDILGTSGSLNAESRTLDLIDTDLTLPLTERYFLGGLGQYQLRGFKARSVGPRRSILKRSGLFGTGTLFSPVGVDSATGVCVDSGGSGNQGNGNGKCNSLDDTKLDDFDDLDETDIIGGSKFLSLTAEYRFPISELLGLMGIVFLDTGNAFAENDSIFDVSQWRWGTGVGVLWFSPFGPLQAFIGIPLDPVEGEESQVFEFSVGGANF